VSLFNVFDIASSALGAQSSNIANADSTTAANGQPYRARQVVFATTPVAGAGQDAAGVRVTGVVEDTSPLRRQYDPKHPMADSEGYVTLPNVNVVEEMVNMISASRSYQTNVEMMSTAKSLLLKTLNLGN